MKKIIEQNYASPRWSGEILDCSMPLTFDQYNRCSFDCLYCFAFFQRSLSVHNEAVKDKRLYTEKPPVSVNPARIKKMFSGELKCEFSDYIKDRVTFQWGGMSDPFDMFEKKYGIGLDLLQHLHAMKYPICFSTKGTWWMKDERYFKLFRNNDFWNMKVSIINLDPKKAAVMERGVPTPQERLLGIKTLAAVLKGGVTLRLRPFIIGYSDYQDEYLNLIESAAKAGATALSTEFLCIESRTTPASELRFKAMSEIIGMDVIDFYKRNTVSPQGYLRLNWKIKKPFVDKMEALCKKLKMRFYVSDAHHKDRCCNGSCCGLGNNWKVHKGQFTAALVEAKEKGQVSWDWMEKNLLPSLDKIGIVQATGLNIARGNPEDRARFKDWSIKDYIRYIWNNPKHPRSPYRYFYGLMKPIKLDNKKNVVYQYNSYK